MSYDFFLQTSYHIVVKGHANKATRYDEGFYEVQMRYAHGGMITDRKANSVSQDKRAVKAEKVVWKRRSLYICVEKHRENT